jgi:hypothetical protein
MRNMTTITLVLMFIGSLTTASMATDKGEGHGRGKGPARAKMMEKFDKDGDGKLSDEEKSAAKAAHKEMMTERKAKFMEKFDTDGDGELSDEEKAVTKKSCNGCRGHGKSEKPTAGSFIR